MNVTGVACRMLLGPCLIVACARLPARASTAPAAATPSPLPEIGRVVTSDRAEEPVRSAAKTTYIVTKSDMIARGYASVADALVSVPGIVVARYGGLGSSANIGIRGTSSSQVLVLLDGRPLGGAQTGTVDLGAISTSGVERIEIVEGGGATLYGAGAIGGVVNILTTHPSPVPLLQVGAGSFDTHAFDAETPSLTVQRLVSKNDYGYVGTTVPSGTRLNADAESTIVRVRGGTMLGRLRLEGSAGIADEHLGVPGPIALPFSSPPPDPSLFSSYQSSTTRQNTQNSDARVSFTLERRTATTTLDVSATQQSLLFYSSPGDPLACYTALNTQPCEDLTKESRLGASLRHVVQSSAQRLVYGIDVARGVARIDGGGGKVPVNAFAQTAAYVQDNATLGEVSTYAGIRGERDGGQGAVVAPSVGGIASLSPALRVRANYAVGFRAPNAVDLYYPGFSNAALRPERTQNFDATVSAERVLGGTSLAYFSLSGADLIVVNPRFDYGKPAGPSNQYLLNAQHASIAGLTLDARTAPFHGFTAALGITDLYRALDLTSAARRLADRPVFTTSLSLEYSHAQARRGVIAFGLIAHGMGARSSVPRGGAIDSTQYAAAFLSVDAYVRVRLARRAILSLRGWNVGNERYSAIASPPFGGYPAPGRSFAAELSTR